MEQIKGQMDIFDYIPRLEPEKKRHLGYCSAEYAERIRGRSLRLRDPETPGAYEVMKNARKSEADR